MITRTTTVVAAMAAIAGTAAADLESDFAIGVSGSGQLKFEFNFDSIEPLPFNDDFDVWISDEPGFANIDENEPDEDFFMLPAGAFISIEVLSTDPGFRVVDPEFDPFGGDTVESATVSAFDLGSPDFDDHPFWAVQLSEWDGVTTEFNVTLQAVDSGAGLAASDPITVTFTIPAPGSVLAMAGLGLVAGVRRRR